MNSNIKPLIHFHTDCDFFAGCEFMVANIVNDPEFQKRYDYRLSFRTSEDYLLGLSAKIPETSKLIPLKLPNAEALMGKLIRKDGPFAKLAGGFLVRLLEVPFGLVDLVVMFKSLKKTSPDLLHINNGGYPGALSCRIAALAGRLAGVPVQIMVVNNQAVSYGSFARNTERLLDAVVVKCKPLFITGSISASERLGQILKVPAHRRKVVNNGVQINLPESKEVDRLANEPIRFGVVAHHVPRKGHLVLLQAIAQLRDSGKLQPGAGIFSIEGFGPETQKIQGEINHLNLERIVEMVGPAVAVHEFMQSLDVLVLPSVSNEDFPNVISEAMGLGLPVIATRVGGIPEQIEHLHNGLLVMPGDASDLANAIVFALVNPAWRAEAGRIGLARFEHSYRVDIAVRKYMEIYDEMILGGAQ
jgi:glycosyltransferase involved in cell wall biosynthesis